MGLAKKGTSRITVDDLVCRWVVSGNDGFLDLVVEIEEGHGQRLCVQFNYDFGEMTPGHVREIILAALAAGWTPRERAKQLDVRLVDGDLVSMQEIRERLPGEE